jgi:hypothetical protein
MTTKPVYGRKASVTTRGSVMVTVAFVRNANAYSQLRFLPPWQRMQLKKYLARSGYRHGTTQRLCFSPQSKERRRQGATQSSDTSRPTGAKRRPFFIIVEAKRYTRDSPRSKQNARPTKFNHRRRRHGGRRFHWHSKIGSTHRSRKAQQTCQAYRQNTTSHGPTPSLRLKFTLSATEGAAQAAISRFPIIKLD